ncbi:olfactory receptor 14A16-like [Neomonachus schauinslandi]|uniref:Olfactory receptor n=1 Tax=Neomonachus schauinslandi TaxID=29088 RepID=A0A2Y9H8J7_NEOSC|nr:olfactory receptor 14A16-like [Neomonachus schauinslandi]
MTNITTFLLMGFPEDQVLQRLYAAFFSLVYLAALMGNLLIITLTTIDQHLQTPMYFFLKNLSLIDICYISVTVPKSVMNSLTNSHSISFVGCASQVFLVVFFAGAEFALLLVMSYDRCAAICCPLHYEAIMNRGACVQMVRASWFSGCVYGSIHVAGTFSVHFCGSNIVHQFFCDIPSLLTLACSGEQTLEYAFIIGSCCFGFICFILVVVSYVYIFSTVLRIPSAKGRVKSLSTCLPHLTVVTLFFFSGIITYLAKNFKSSSSLKVLISVLYTVLPPTMNPLIYSLRNWDIQMALGKLIAGKLFRRLFKFKYRRTIKGMVKLLWLLVFQELRMSEDDDDSIHIKALIPRISIEMLYFVINKLQITISK